MDKRTWTIEEARDDLDARFWAKVDKSSDCWLWTGGTVRGYGVIRISLRAPKDSGKLVYAHRAAFEMANGTIPAKLQIDHMCHTLACVRAEHLRTATRKQNAENLLLSPQNTSGYRGVMWNKTSGKWEVQVKHNGERHFGGRLFTDIEEANARAIAIRNELFTHNIEAA